MLNCDLFGEVLGLLEDSGKKGIYHSAIHCGRITVLENASHNSFIKYA